MKIAPLKVSDPWFGRIVNNEQVPADNLQSVPIESTVEMELVELLHSGPEENYRPYLHLRGELTEARPAVELPYGVSELVLRRGAGLPVDAYYDFNHQQLCDLVSKGYFTEAFTVPEGMSGIPWNLPGKADFLVVAPELSDQPPLVFMSVHDQSSLALDEANSGYELTEYFPDYTTQDQPEAVAEASVAQFDGMVPGLDVFSDVDFDEPALSSRDVSAQFGAAEADAAERRSFVPESVFSRLISEIEARQPAVPVQEEEDTEVEVITPGSAEEVYLSRVSPGVAQVLAGDHLTADESDPAEASNEDVFVSDDDVAVDEPLEPELAAPSLTPDGFVDFGDPEPELVPLAEQFGGASAEDHRLAAERRAARIRAELSGAQAAEADGEAEPVL